jgi:hypothetical protein
MIYLLPLQYIQILLCLITRLGLLVNTLVRALMAYRKDSQLDADAVEPNTINTIAVARLYRSSARKPNAPVRSAWILANQKQALTLARAISIISVG